MTINEARQIVGKTIALAHGGTAIESLREADPRPNTDESIVFKVYGFDENGMEVNSEFSIHWRDV